MNEYNSGIILLEQKANIGYSPLKVSNLKLRVYVWTRMRMDVWLEETQLENVQKTHLKKKSFPKMIHRVCVSKISFLVDKWLVIWVTFR